MTTYSRRYIKTIHICPFLRSFYGWMLYMFGVPLQTILERINLITFYDDAFVSAIKIVCAYTKMLNTLRTFRMYWFINMLGRLYAANCLPEATWYPIWLLFNSDCGRLNLCSAKNTDRKKYVFHNDNIPYIQFDTHNQ